jgi:hypothetical protein
VPARPLARVLDVIRGSRTAFLRRGPWAVIQQQDPDVERVPTIGVDGLDELAGRIAAVSSAACG